MGYHIGWDNEDKTVLLQQYTDPATKDDMYQLVRLSAEMLNLYSHMIHLIIDERNVDFIFTSADQAHIEKMLTKNQGAVMVVVQSHNLTYKTVSQQLYKRPSTRNHPNFVQSMEEARAFLQENFGVSYCSSVIENVRE